MAQALANCDTVALKQVVNLMAVDLKELANSKMDEKQCQIGQEKIEQFDHCHRNEAEYES